MLTKKQKNLLLFINKKLRAGGVSPSYEEMKDSLNLKSKSGIHRLISALEERGFIRRLAHKARALEVIKLPETASANDIYNSFSPSVIKGGLDKENTNTQEMEIPVLGKIAAGTPVEAIQNEVSRIPLPSNLEKNGQYFGLKVQGDSMIEAGINEGDTVIIKKTDTADNGKIVVALIDEHEAMLKRIRRKGKTVALESANRNYETKIFGPDRVKVQGDSMIEAGINEGDTVIIKRSDTADNGKIVVALIDEHEAMLKRIRRKGKTVALESANRNYETKIFGPDRVKVQGVLVSLYRNF